MVERSVVASFTGQLFEAAATTKKWTSISSGSASIQIVNTEEESHQIVGLDEDNEVFVHDINNDIQLRSKDNFVQWKKKDLAGKLTTYGVRLKDSRESQRLEGIVGGILAMLETIPSPAPWPTDSKPQANEKPIKMDHEKDTLLKVHLPGKQTTVITVPPSITMEELLSLIVMKRHLDPRYYELVLPPSKPKSMQAQLVPTTALRTLNITEIHVVKRSKPLTDKKHHASSPPDKTKQPLLTKQRSMTLPSSQKRNGPPSSVQTQMPPLNQKRTPQPSTQNQTPMTIVTVHLPYDQRTVIQVSPTMTMPQLLVYICEKRNLNPAHHTLALPSPTSGQMRMATREMTVSSLRTSVITLVDLKAPISGNPNSMIPDYNVSGKKGGFSPTEVKPTGVEIPKKRTAPQIPANEVKRTTTQNAMHSVEATVVEKSDKEQPPIKHIAKRKAPPPPKGAKKDTTVPLSQREPENNLSLGNPPHFGAHTKAPPPPGSPAKRPAPAVPTAAKQPIQMSKQTSDSALTTHQPPPSPLKRLLPSTTEDVTDHPVAVPSVSAAKKRRPAPTRPAPTLPNPHVRHKSDSSAEFQHDDLMDTSVPDHMTAQLQQRANRPGSATSAQIKLEINELEASLADVVEEAEWHLQQQTTSKQDHPVDETDSDYTSMEVSATQSSTETGNKIVSQPQALGPDKMLSESGTVRGIKGRVKEQIASNQSKLMIEGLLVKKQQPFARTPLSVFHKAENLDEAQTSDHRTSLKRYGSQEAISTKENEDVMKRSNSLRSNQSTKETDRKQKPRGKAPPPPQDKVKAKQPQSKPLDHQPTAAPEGHNDTIPTENNEILQQNTETLVKQTASNFTLTDKIITTTPDTGKKVPPKVKPKTTRAKSKEAEDNTMVVPEVVPPEVVRDQSKPHTSLSKRAKSESQIKRIPRASPKTDKKPNAIIESSNDGQQVLVLSPTGGNATNKDTSVRIFLPPPPPMLPPSQEQDSNIKDSADNEIPKDIAPVSTNDSTAVTNNKVCTVESTMVNKLHSNVITSGTTNNKEQKVEHNKTTLQQQKVDNISHFTDNDDLEVDSEMEGIKPLPHVLFQSREDLPPTPPGSPCDELEMAEMKMVESESHDDDDIDVVPPPPLLDDLNIDDVDGMIPPPDDFDPLSLPPPLLVDEDDVLDIIPPPTPSIGDDIIVTTAAPPPLSTADDAFVTITAPPPPEDDAVAVTTEIPSQPFEDDGTFEDLPIKPLPLLANDEASAVPDHESDHNDDDDEIMLNLLPDDVSLSESDTELPATMITSKLESTEPDAIVDVEQDDEDDEIISQPDVKTENIITASTESDVSDDVEDKKSEEQTETAEIQQSEDELSNIIASLETMLQDEPQSNEKQVMDDTNTISPPCTGVQSPGDDQILAEISTEAPVDGSKDDVIKADLDQQPSSDVNQIVTVIPKLDTETTDIKPKAAAPFPARAAPPPPPLPPIGKVKSPPKLVTSPTNNTTSPTKAKSPPPAVKPKPKRPISESLAEEFQDELAEKLKRRQQKIHDWAKDDDKPKPLPQTAPTAFAKRPSATQARTATQNIIPAVPNLQATSVPLMQGAASNTQYTISPSGTQEQMEQFQLLQNQMLQQQILMLQQQLQQLQQQIPQGQMASNPMMAMPQIMPQAGIGMQIPQVGNGVQTGSGMQIPQVANLIQAPQLSTGMRVPLQHQNETPMHNSARTSTDGRVLIATRTPKTTTGLNASTDSESTCSESPPPPPLPATSPPPLDSSPYNDQVIRRSINKTTSDSALQQRPTSQVLRSRAFGEYEDVLDDILEEVRETDHDAILKKPPPPPNQTGAGGPHTEMASLLAEAMKQRRINITSSRRLSSASAEEESDTTHEWD